MRRIGKHILIIPEGWTEYIYAQGLKQSLPKEKQRCFKIEMPQPDCNNKSLQLLEKAQSMLIKERKERNPYDAVWIFLDNDNQPNLDTFFHKINLTNIKLAYSSICIEHWFILHFENNQKTYPNTQKAIKRIEKLWLDNFGNKYHKTKIPHFEILIKRLEFAIQRANAIKSKADSEGIPIYQRNPFFTIQDLIKFIREI